MVTTRRRIVKKKNKIDELCQVPTTGKRIGTLPSDSSRGVALTTPPPVTTVGRSLDTVARLILGYTSSAPGRWWPGQRGLRPTGRLLSLPVNLFVGLLCLGAVHRLYLVEHLFTMFQIEAHHTIEQRAMR
ncbi:hypothetical protein EVAR_39071_1 [Eumeta japonica]|uniref:Uncharacterized protein n=1 Tax=Eumeta variegata TaxID=151549 RepID=A0A4C1WMB4_EUMVA|nr:hypothetical protein EVAR_39071_1 [Eumeta japonica]